MNEPRRPRPIFHNDKDPGSFDWYWENTRENLENEEENIADEVDELEGEWTSDTPTIDISEIPTDI